MKPALLLDTHVALWWFSADARLPVAERELIRGRRCLVSLASVWEVAIKYKLDKLPVSPADFLKAAEDAGMRVLPIRPEHIVATTGLPMLHRDPFDRMLIAQATTESLMLLTADGRLADYGASVRAV